MNWIKDLDSCNVIGKKRVEYRGAKKTEWIDERIEFINDKIQSIKEEMGCMVFKKELRQMRDRHGTTFASQRKTEAKEEAQEALKKKTTRSVCKGEGDWN